MPPPNETSEPAPDDLQFEQAEFADESTAGSEQASWCISCKEPITDVYFEAGGGIVCTPCRDKIETMFHGGSRLTRMLKALVFGTIGAAAGAFLYHAIMTITGLNIGLVAVVVGVIVGGAVKAGSANRGGLFYQFLAVFLTYSAIVAMYAVPAIIEAFRRDPDAAKAARVANGDNARPAAKPQAEGEDRPQPGPVVDRPRNADQPRLNPVRVMVVFGVIAAMMIGLAYSIPVEIAIASPISGLIFGFALWEAWKINRKARLAFNGPFRLDALKPEAAAFDVEEASGEH